MYFKDSCITKVTPVSIMEESTVLPDGIFPDYIGSGNVVMAVDASGLQSLNNRKLQHGFGAVPVTGDLYVVAHGMMGNQLTACNALPYGYFTWQAEFDNGLKIDGDNLKDHAALWQRKLFLEEGRVETEMLLDYYCKIGISATMPLEKRCVVIDVSLKRFDYQLLNYVPERAPNSIVLTVKLNLYARETRVSFYDKISVKGNVADVEVSGNEQYRYQIRIDNAEQTPIEWKDGALCASFRFDLAEDEKTVRFLYSFGGEKLGDIELLLRENLWKRRAYFKGIARVDGVDVQEAFLYNNSHYLAMSGFNYSMGLPIGMPFMLPVWWRCSTFWDSHFVMDGLMRANCKSQADAFLRFLHRSMNAEGKPFPWMFAYDGKATVEESKDIAPLVMCAHAMTAAKHFHYFQDRAMLEECGYPILERVSKFGAELLFSKDTDGAYILSMPVSNDVVEDEAVEINQTFTALWFLSIFQQCLNMQKVLNLPQDQKFQEILSHYKLEQNGQEYLHAKNTTARECPWASWLPFLLYPTEGMPFVDMELFHRTREKYTYPELYMVKQGSYQPWTEFMEADSDFRRGAVEKGYALRKLGMEHCFGPGLFSEVGPKQQTCGMPPYISAHGTYMTSFLYQFITTDIWNNRIGIFTNMPQAYQTSNLSVQNVVCSGGAKVDAVISEYRTKAVVTCDKKACFTIDVAVPRKLCKELLRVYVDGKEIMPELSTNGFVTLFLEIDGTVTIEVQ